MLHHPHGAFTSDGCCRRPKDTLHRALPLTLQHLGLTMSRESHLGFCLGSCAKLLHPSPGMAGEDVLSSSRCAGDLLDLDISDPTPAASAAPPAAAAAQQAPVEGAHPYACMCVVFRHMQH